MSILRLTFLSLQNLYLYNDLNTTYTPTRSSSGTRTSRFNTQSLSDSSVVPYLLSSPDCCGGTTYSSDLSSLVFTG